MYHKRVKGYAKLGYVAKTDYDEPDDVGVLFDQDDFLPVLQKDMNDARLSITIAFLVSRSLFVSLVYRKRQNTDTRNHSHLIYEHTQYQ